MMASEDQGVESREFSEISYFQAALPLENN
jgi:hypothetical protein